MPMVGCHNSKDRYNNRRCAIWKHWVLPCALFVYAAIMFSVCRNNDGLCENDDAVWFKNIHRNASKNWNSVLTKARLYGILSNSKWERRNGGIGRRPGLKIPWDSPLVPVQARFPAPNGFPQTNQYRGVEQLVARRAHNPEVVGSSPSPATILWSQKRYHGFEPSKSHDFEGFSRVSSLFRKHGVYGYRVQKKRYHFKKTASDRIWTWYVPNFLDTVGRTE